MRPKHYPYRGNSIKKELEKPVQFQNPEQIFRDFTLAALKCLNPISKNDIDAACNLIKAYRYHL